ncbi:MAG: histidine phosphatase family protein [Paracoccaceae bacterium]|nr:histidine phosphatase family protein [Paracoccaceae bacterium]MDE2914734.1 histidine phosphatase family protein [Paracoccaceae bacterium]
MTRWWWVRHAPTHSTALYGWTDLPGDLSDTVTIHRLEAFLPRDALVVASPLIRASATADAIQRNRQRLPDEPDLKELHFGAWDGLRFDQIVPEDQPLARDFWQCPGDVAPPGGESWNQVGNRVGAAVARLTRENGGRDIIAVAHFGVILAQLQRATGMPPVAAIAFEIGNLSVTCMEFHPCGAWPAGHWRVRFVNHLP